MNTYRITNHIKKHPSKALAVLCKYSREYIVSHPDASIVDVWIAINKELDSNESLYPSQGITIRTSMTIRHKWDTGTIKISYKRLGMFQMTALDIRNY